MKENEAPNFKEFHVKSKVLAAQSSNVKKYEALHHLRTRERKSACLPGKNYGALKRSPLDEHQQSKSARCLGEYQEEKKWSPLCKH